MTVYLGNVGALVALPDPDPGVGATLARPRQEHATLGGGRTVDYAGPGRRTYTMAWERLTPAEYAVLEAFHTGGWGPGPFLLLPTAAGWNYLTPQQASATDVLATTDGFGGPAVMASSTAYAATGRRSLAWSLPANPTADHVLALTVQHNLPGLPVIPGVPLTWTAQVRAAAPITVTLIAEFGDADDHTLPGTATSTPVTAGPGWQTLTLTATPPTGAALTYPGVNVAPGSVTAPTVLYVDALRVDLGPTAPGWLPGRGVPLVSLVELTCSYPWADELSAAATFLEVGAG
ncbi:hypothetical protein Lfu02_80190 [Longispora fulva]|uniref:Uncharacterized protein n=1 Tax=Longispora fulva TaxID=619741 RepID=A0A8J7KMM9_9ACTN|nr:hypothetical protein [Longispora fulva]MBG6140689.1 hypothetical protein [Longispora fulva]GIG63647.1 hypothetical protein Lfu02_80190 [Longispora fulva]